MCCRACDGGVGSSGWSSVRACLDGEEATRVGSRLGDRRQRAFYRVLGSLGQVEMNAFSKKIKKKRIELMNKDERVLASSESSGKPSVSLSLSLSLPCAWWTGHALESIALVGREEDRNGGRGSSMAALGGDGTSDDVESTRGTTGSKRMTGRRERVLFCCGCKGQLRRRNERVGRRGRRNGENPHQTAAAEASGKLRWDPRDGGRDLNPWWVPAPRRFLCVREATHSGLAGECP